MSFMAIAIGLLVVVAFTVFYFWPCFILWAIFAPKVAARLLYSEKTEKDFPKPLRVLQYLNGWIVCLLPFFWKKHFMKERGIRYYSCKLQLKYYFLYERNGKTVQNMSPAGYKALWYSDKLDQRDYEPLMSREGSQNFFTSMGIGRQVNAVHLLGSRVELIEIMSDDAIKLLLSTTRDYVTDFRNVIMAGRVLTDSMFRTLCDETELVMMYVKGHTPSDGMMNIMLEKTTFDKESRLKDEIIPYCISRYGLSPKLIRSLANRGRLDEFEGSLREYMERTFIQRHASESDRKLVKAFFEERVELCVEAQKVMKPWQYRLFHEAGLRIDESVLESFIEKEDVPMLKVIFELDPEIKSSDIAGAMAMANPTITDLVMQLAK